MLYYVIIIYSESDYVCEDFGADINFLIHRFFGQFPGCQIML